MKYSRPSLVWDLQQTLTSMGPVLVQISIIMKNNFPAKKNLTKILSNLRFCKIIGRKIFHFQVRSYHNPTTLDIHLSRSSRILYQALFPMTALGTTLHSCSVQLAESPPKQEPWVQGNIHSCRSVGCVPPHPRAFGMRLHSCSAVGYVSPPQSLLV